MEVFEFRGRLEAKHFTCFLGSVQAADLQAQVTAADPHHRAWPDVAGDLNAAVVVPCADIADSEGRRHSERKAVFRDSDTDTPRAIRRLCKSRHRESEGPRTGTRKPLSHAHPFVEALLRRSGTGQPNA